MIKDSGLTLKELLNRSEMKECLSDGQIEKIDATMVLPVSHSDDPLYIRVFSVIGAWLAGTLVAFGSYMLIEEFGPVDYDYIGLIFGAALLILSVIIRRKTKNLFFEQFSLVIAFAGNFMIIAGLQLPERFNSIGGYTLVQGIICVIMYLAYPDRLLRFLQPLVFAFFLTALVYSEQLYFALHFIILAETLLAGYLLFFAPWKKSLQPLSWSAVLMLPITLLSMNMFGADLWRSEFNQPYWPSSLIIAIAFLLAVIHLAGGPAKLRYPWLAVACGAIVLLAVFATPGILVALLLFVLAKAFEDRYLLVLSLLFFILFLILFYYYLQISLEYKAYIIAGSGLVLILFRAVLLRLLKMRGEE